MEERTEYSMIRSMRLAGFLMYKGYKIINMSKDKFNNDRKLFWFATTPELIETIREYNRLNEKRGTQDGNTKTLSGELHKL